MHCSLQLNIMFVASGDFSLFLFLERSIVMFKMLV